MKLKTILSVAAFACGSQALATILPPNNLHLQDNVNFIADIDEAKFNKIVNDIVAFYKPIVAAHGGRLSSNNLWSNATVNASANQMGNDWVINMYGGLARRPEVTPDGFALVVCHEMGHHLAGYAFYGDTPWAASEGQSDYFATQSCAKEAWRLQTEENAKFRATVNPHAKEKCDVAYSNVDEQNLCYRSSMAGASLATLLSALGRGPAPKFETPDAKVVTTTYEAHPEGQCRMDTYFNGSLCTAGFNPNIIPGKGHPDGQGSVGAEEVASRYSCTEAAGFSLGNRPRCWFAPKLQFLGIQFSSVQWQEMAGNNNGSIDPGEAIAFDFFLNNGSQAVTTNVTGKLVSKTPGVAVTSSESAYPDLSPGQPQANQSKFVVDVSRNVACGSAINLELAASSSRGSVKIAKEFTVGKLIEALVGQNTSAMPIPDKGQVSSSIQSNVTGAVAKALVHVNISHTYLQDLKIYLKGPSGREIFIANPANRPDNKLDADYTVALSAPDAAGAWTLRVSDEDYQDTGTLNFWSLKVLNAQCN